MVTIRQIAEQCGVSVSTVSKALNDAIMPIGAKLYQQASDNKKDDKQSDDKKDDGDTVEGEVVDK